MLVVFTPQSTPLRSSPASTSQLHVLFICVCEYMYVHACVYRHPQKSGEGLRSPQAKVTVQHKRGNQRTKLSPPKGQQVLPNNCWAISPAPPPQLPPLLCFVFYDPLGLISSTNF